MHYINKKGDVLVSLDEPTDKSFIEIPHFSSGIDYCIINYNDLFTFAECMANCYKEFPDESTQAARMQNWIKSHGKKFPEESMDSYWHGQSLWEEKKWRFYDMLSMSTLYGGNYRKFDLLKPFIIPGEFIVEMGKNWNGDKIDEFKDKLINGKYIRIEGYVSRNPSGNRKVRRLIR